MKLKKQRHIGTQLNEQAIHFEVILRKIRPDILEKRAETLATKPEAVAAFRESRDPVKIILAEQGLLKEGSNTIVYD
jgi:hypothetical protein